MSVSAADLLNLYPSGVRLREDIPLKTDLGKGEALFIAAKPFSIKGLAKAQAEAIERLKNGLGSQLLKEVLEDPKIQKIFALLQKAGLLRGSIDIEEDSRDSRQLEWLSHFHAQPQKVHEQLKNKKVVILGCGGTGSIVAMHLARAGIQKFVLVDGASVDAPDLNRQLTYTEKDLGSPKAEKLAEYLRHTAEVTDLNFFEQTIDATEKVLALGEADLLINCADKPMGRIQRIVTDAAIQINVPALFGSVGLEVGTVGPFLVSEKAKSQFGRESEEVHEKWKDAHSILKSSICFTNTLVATQMAFEAFLYLSENPHFDLMDSSYDVDFFSGERKKKINWSER